MKGAPRADGPRMAYTTDTAIGASMMVVALFEIHIDNTAAAIMKPPTIPDWLLPALLTMFSAIRECRFQRCTDVAMMKPPSSIITMGLE